MTSDLESRLRDAFRADAEQARLVHPDGPPSVHEVHLSAPRGPRHLVAVAAAVVLVVIGTVGAVVLADEDDVSVDSASDAGTGDGRAALLAELDPGEVVELPPAPIGARSGLSSVWSGDELLLWGGADDELGLAADGAAYDPASGTWRRIPPRPDGPAAFADLLWTGTEMVVWGGIGGSTNAGDAVPQHDGAVYDPARGTWRRIPAPPIRSSVDHTSRPVWADGELVVLGGDGAVAQAAAYDLRTGEWRRLAPLPAELLRPLWSSDPVWTGRSILVAATIVDPAVADGAFVGDVVLRYDLATDEWTTVREATVVDIVGVPDDDGEGDAATVLAVPDERGAPVEVLDRSGRPVDDLPAVPVDAATFGERIGALGTWTGEEALFEVWGDTWLRASDGTSEWWALDPSAGTWRLVQNGGPDVAMAGEILFTWEGDASAGSDPLRVTARRRPG